MTSKNQSTPTYLTSPVGHLLNKSFPNEFIKRLRSESFSMSTSYMVQLCNTDSTSNTDHYDMDTSVAKFTRWYR